MINWVLCRLVSVVVSVGMGRGVLFRLVSLCRWLGCVVVMFRCRLVMLYSLENVCSMIRLLCCVIWVIRLGCLLYCR